MKLNLGGGSKEMEGFINVDLKGDGMIWDLNKYPYPFKDNSIEEIKAFHIIEHLNNYQLFFKEVLRMLKPRGKLHIKVPHFTSHGAFSEYHIHKGFWYYCFTNKRMITKTSLDLEDNIFNKFDEIKRKINFENKYFWNWLIKPLVNLWVFPVIYETTFLYSLFPAKEIEIILIKSGKEYAK